ncbi:MAG: SUMF1/EgtB/PvdO family nonheme iron enzyme [Bryobacterales bacterium]|nr:SUMF1/EgtB/PvdO family nonheme iron enzyme [Bryobacterales bacterium]
MGSPTVFVSYSHRDKDLTARLVTHLRVLQKQEQLDLWVDTRIGAGGDWYKEIETAIERASVAVLVISAEFLTSDFINREEVPRLLRRAAEFGLTIVPVIAKPCTWNEVGWLARLQARPRDGRPLSVGSDSQIDTDLTQITEEIAGILRSKGEPTVERQTLVLDKRRSADVENLIRLSPQELGQPGHGQQPHVLIPGRSILIANRHYTFVRRGTFLMGSDDGYEHERPRHKVAVSSYFLATTPVTNLEFSEFAKDAAYFTTAEKNGAGLHWSDGEWRFVDGADWLHPLGPQSSIKDRINHPVVQVSWYDARSYCDWLSARTGLSFDLPSEAQWEYAAGGGRSTRWSFGEIYDRSLANVEGEDTSAVGTYGPNGLGLFDMTGNVYEWCSDWFALSWPDAGHELAGEVTADPAGPIIGDSRVLKGGSWFDVETNCRIANRFSTGPSLASSNWGLRPCLRLTDALFARLLSNARWGVSARDML